MQGNPKIALDYPALDDDLFIIWAGNEFLWPDARRETHYLSARRDALRGYALFTPFPEGALTFATMDEASEFLAQMNSRRPRPYHSVHVTTVAEMKVARGYAPKPDTPSAEPEF